MIDLEEAKRCLEDLRRMDTKDERISLARVFIRDFIDEVQTLRATLALHLGVAEDDPIITKNEVLQELETLRKLVEAQKELIKYQDEKTSWEADHAKPTIQELRTKIAELAKKADSTDNVLIGDDDQMGNYL